MKSKYAGFTLVELLVVLTIIGILASIAIPKYLEVSTDAKVSTCKGALGNIRSALTIYRAHSILKGAPSWPSIDFVKDNDRNTGSGIMEDGNLPNNPFSKGAVKDAVVEVHGKPTPAGCSGAWAYDPDTGGFWANTNSGNGEIDF